MKREEVIKLADKYAMDSGVAYGAVNRVDIIVKSLPIEVMTALKYYGGGEVIMVPWGPWNKVVDGVVPIYVGLPVVGVKPKVVIKKEVRECSGVGRVVCNDRNIYGIFGIDCGNNSWKDDEVEVLFREMGLMREDYGKEINQEWVNKVLIDWVNKIGYECVLCETVCSREVYTSVGNYFFGHRVPKGISYRKSKIISNKNSRIYDSEPIEYRHFFNITLRIKGFWGIVNVIGII